MAAATVSTGERQPIATAINSIRASGGSLGALDGWCARKVVAMAGKEVDIILPNEPPPPTRTAETRERERPNEVTLLLLSSAPMLRRVAMAPATARAGGGSGAWAKNSYIVTTTHFAVVRSA